MCWSVEGSWRQQFWLIRIGRLLREYRNVSCHRHREQNQNNDRELLFRSVFQILDSLDFGSSFGSLSGLAGV